MVICGWCGHPTAGDPCSACGHEDPARPWVQRGGEPPTVRVDAVGRPVADPKAMSRRLAAARKQLTESGRPVTVAALAEVLDVSDRTVRRWMAA